MSDQQPAPAPRHEVSRELVATLPRKSQHVLVLAGVRRGGKSTLQAQLMRRQRRHFYCNLEDLRLFDFGMADFGTFLQLVDELAPAPAPIFLDEVQEIAGWQRLVRALLDRGRVICVTGSNASLLGSELGSKLTGRQLSFEVFPFSYAEHLAFTKSKASAQSLRVYLDDGGFPAFLRERDPHILQELLRDIVQRDIAVRHRLREARHVMNLVLFLFAHTGQAFSLQTLTKGLAIPTVSQTSRYLEYLEDAYLLFGVPKFSASFKKRVVAPKKYYAIDNGLRRVNSPQLTPDIGRRLENAVFLALRRRGESVTYASEKDTWECDFITNSAAIQACAELTEDNREREIRGALRGAALTGHRRALILTLAQTDRIEIDGQVVEVEPMWRWEQEW